MFLCLEKDCLYLLEAAASTHIDYTHIVVGDVVSSSFRFLRYKYRLNMDFANENAH